MTEKDPKKGKPTNIETALNTEAKKEEERRYVDATGEKRIERNRRLSEYYKMLNKLSGSGQRER